MYYNPYICEKKPNCICLDGSPANKNTDMCKHESLYIINRYQTCARLVLQYLIDQSFEEETEMAALFDYMLTVPVQWFLNYNDTAICTDIRTKIQKQIEFYKINPPTNNKFASDISEMENMLKVKPGYIAPNPRTMSEESSKLLYPYTNQSPSDEEYYQYVYDENDRKCLNTVQRGTRYYHIMTGANLWWDMFEEDEETE